MLALLAVATGITACNKEQTCPHERTERGGIRFTLEELPWNYHILHENFSVIKVSVASGDGQFASTSANSGVLTIDKTGKTHQLTLATSLTGHTSFEVVSHEGDFLSAVAISGTDKLDFTASQNDTTQERMGKVTIKSLPSNETYTLTIKQGA